MPTSLRICASPRGIWLRERDLNARPAAYEAAELPDCSTPHEMVRAPAVFTTDAPKLVQRLAEAMTQQTAFYSTGVR